MKRQCNGFKILLRNASKKINEKEKRIKSILGKDLNNIHWSMISFCMDSSASIVIFQCKIC